MFYIDQNVVCIKDVVNHHGIILCKEGDIFKVLDIKPCKCKNHVFLYFGHKFPEGIVTSFCSSCHWPVSDNEDRFFILSTYFAPLNETEKEESFADSILEKISESIKKEKEMFETV